MWTSVSPCCVAVLVQKANASTLIGTPLGRTTLRGFHGLHGASWFPPPDYGGAWSGRQTTYMVPDMLHR
jgi:hypothetical protein